MGRGTGGSGRGGGGGVRGINPQARAQIAQQVSEASVPQLVNTLTSARLRQQRATGLERRNMTTYVNLITAELERRGAARRLTRTIRGG